MKNSASPRLLHPGDPLLREVRPGRCTALSGHCLLVPGGPLPSADDRVSIRATLHYIVGVAAEGSGPPGEPACFEGFSLKWRITVNRVLSWFYTVFVGFINKISASFFQQVGRIKIDKK